MMNARRVILGVTLTLMTVASGCGSPSAPTSTEPDAAMVPDATAPDATSPAHLDDSAALDEGAAGTYSVQQFGARGWYVSPFSVRQYYNNYLIRRRCRLLWIPGRFVVRANVRIWVRGHFIVVCLRPFPRPYPTVRPSVRPSPYPTTSPTVRPSPYPTASPTVTPSPYPTVSPTVRPSPYPTVSPTVRPSATPY